MLVIGIAGVAGAGKDTVADWIVECTGRGHKYSFATPIKLMLTTLGFNYEQLYGELKEGVDERYGKTPRDMMQTLGTEWGRKCVSEDIWAKALLRIIAVDRQDLAVIADVRFDNEADLIRERGGWIVHIEGRDLGIAAHHASEAGVSWHANDMMLNNSGELSDLVNRCQPIIERIYSELEQ